MTAEHIVSVSGGKDSTATYLLAIERGRPFRAVFADTGHEHEMTLEFVHSLAARAGGPEIEVVKADFTERMRARRASIPKLWAASGVSDERIKRAVELMQPTGSPFLDLCILKGRFPSTKVRFCTEELKVFPIERGVLAPALARGNVVKWQGERREESAARSELPMFQRVAWPERRTLLIYRPIIHWDAEQVFNLHRRHGLEPNPLYRLGMGRVGCMPCIMCRKGELAEIVRRFPEHIERVKEWEILVADASKYGLATFFAADKTPEGAELARRINETAMREARELHPELADEEDPKPLDRKVAEIVKELSLGVDWPGIEVVAEWSKTSRGGRQYGLEEALPPAACASQYGLCE